MIKSIIEISGAKISVETESTSQFIDIVKGLNNRQSEKKVIVKTKEEKTQTTEKSREWADGKKTWTREEILTLVHAIKDSPLQPISKISKKIPYTVLQNHGKISVISKLARIRRFLFGKQKEAIGPGTAEILESMGYSYGSFEQYKSILRTRNVGWKNVSLTKSKTKSKIKRLSDETVVAIAQMIRPNLDDQRVTGEILKYLKKVGEDRPKTTVYTFVSNIRLYFRTGKTIYVSQAHRDLFNANSLYPVTSEKTNYLGDDIVQTGIDGNPILRRRIPVVEA